MTFNEYQVEAAKTAIYPASARIYYPVFGLCGESGEIAEKVKKLIRDNNFKMTPEVKTALLKEVGDLLWYIAALTSDLGEDLEKVAEMNIQKLRDRQQRNVIQGNGDNR